MKSSRALVLFSGGQDSTTCLAWALSQYEHVETIGFTYGQRHIVEMQQRPLILDALRAHSPLWSERLAEDHCIDLSILGTLSETALTQEMHIHLMDNGLPNTYVPGRNILFVTIASIVAYRRGLERLICGMSQADYSGYPDCRDDAVKAMQLAMNLGMDTRLIIETPLMQKTKQETWELADALGGETLLRIIAELTHTCYTGNREVRHDWGYGCTECPACVLRAQGFKQFMLERIAQHSQ